jgi:hypothetical protein
VEGFRVACAGDLKTGLPILRAQPLGGEKLVGQEVWMMPESEKQKATLRKLLTKSLSIVH